MSDREKLRQLHHDHERDFEALAKEAKHTLVAACKADGLDLHSIETRVKDLQSLLAKADRKEYNDPWNDCEDLVGVRAVVKFRSDLDALERLIKDGFHVITREDKEDESPVEAFGYSSIHYICTLRKDISGPRYDNIKEFKFEIQCRTILMDAWASVSHYLVYKGEASVPSALRRDFHALSALFYIADGQFQSFSESAKSSRSSVEQRAVTGSIADESEVNLETMSVVLEELFPDREQSEPSDVSELVEELKRFDYVSVGDLRAAVEKGYEAAEKYEARHPPGNSNRFASAGIMRQIVALVDESYHQYKYSNELRLEDYRKYLN